jgi:quercetin dioxygenase-like cupin family protein
MSVEPRIGGSDEHRLTEALQPDPQIIHSTYLLEMLNTSTYLPPGAGDAVWIGSFGTIYKVPSEATGGAVAIVEHVLGPKQLGAPLHRHSREDEISHVLEGELTVQQGDRWDTAGVGGTIIKPRGVFHAFWNPGVTPVRFLEVIAPGGFAQYFRELAPLIRPGGLPELAAVTALGGRYGLEFNFAGVPELLARHGLRLG